MHTARSPAAESREGQWHERCPPSPVDARPDRRCVFRPLLGPRRDQRALSGGAGVSSLAVHEKVSLFGIPIAVNGWHGVFHLLTGLGGIAVCVRPGASRTYASPSARSTSWRRSGAV